MYLFISILALGAFLLYLVYRKKKINPPLAFPAKWRIILQEKVDFYRKLNAEQKLQFESDIAHFLANIKITGINIDITIEDRLLVASSAVIPLFGFPAWTYKNLEEVLLYPTSFDRNFNIGSKAEIITGMVGTGPMEGKMILSRPALHMGYQITNDKHNVGIHEFVHLFDKEDGVVDGIPPDFIDKTYTLPWIQLIETKTKEIINEDTKIDSYATYNRKEFFAVTSEYFFESPHLLKEKEPELYKILSKAFNQDLAAVNFSSYSPPKSIGRNDPCPCGSGKKYKHCCLQ